MNHRPELLQLQQRWEGGEAGGAKALRYPGQRDGHAARGYSGQVLHGQLPKLKLSYPAAGFLPRNQRLFRFFFCALLGGST
jgi:hypothetical protein